MLGRNVLDTRAGRLATFGMLYVAEGIPLGFTATAMAAYMRRDGLDVAQIGTFVAMLYVPWGFKWAWAPLIDLLKLERFGGRKAWIVMCLVMMIGTLFTAGSIDFLNEFQLLVVLIFIHNLFAATQDVAIDSLAVNTLKEDERGRGNGFMFAGAYIGQGLGGGGALLVAGLWGFDAALIYACVLLSIVLVFTLVFVRDPALGGGSAGGPSVWRKFLIAIKDFLAELYRGFFRSGRGPMVGVLFALTPMGAMSLSTAVATSMQVDFGLDDGQIAQLSLFSTFLSGLGCVIGGWLGDALGLRRMVALFFTLSAVPVIYLGLQISGDAGLQGISLAAFFATFMTFAFILGLHYGTRAAVFMSLTNPLVAATQFTGFMALSNLTITYTNVWQGRVADAFGYDTVLFIDAALIVVPLLIIPFLNPRQDRADSAPSAAAPLPEAG